MSVDKQIKIEAENLLNELVSKNISVEISGSNSLRIRGKMTKTQFEIVKRWKAQFLELLSPKCSYCGLKLEIWKNKLFCPMGCRNSKNTD